MFDYAARLERARKEMAARGVDVLLASVGSDLPYLTGYTAMPLERLTMAVIRRDGSATLVVPELEAPRVTSRSEVFAIRAFGETEDPVAIVAGLAAGARSAAIADQTWARFLLRLQDAMPQARFRSAAGISAALRVIKEPAEIELLRRAGAVADRVAGLLGQSEFGGLSEVAVSRRVAELLIANGGDTAEFAIVGSGPNGASPHHEAGPRIIGDGDSIVVDFGGSVGGYQSDTTRMYHVGEPGPRYLEVHRVVQQAQEAAVGAVRPGVTAAAVDAAARRVIEVAGFGPYFIHRTGHGIGLDVHEDPYIIAGNEQVLEPGMTFSIEPGIYLPGEFGVRIEDIVVCTEEGVERLNRSSRAVAITG
jgi:Xaa-Pro aminopeptidase